MADIRVRYPSNRGKLGYIVDSNEIFENKGYKELTLLCSQSGTDKPTIDDVLVNDFDADFAFTRIDATGVGLDEYRLFTVPTATDIFPIDKTHVVFTIGQGVGNKIIQRTFKELDRLAFVSLRPETGIAEDIDGQFEISVKVYN